MSVDKKWTDIRIFISSTFNDMHAERDYLIQEVFPELREWCEKRRIRMTDIDLRWGVSKEDSESGNTIMACLNCIDECRPFFLCFLGQRRGWVPDPAQKRDISEEAIAKYEGLKDLLGIYSITEMEIEHATLAPMVYLMKDERYRPDKSKALFFFRNDPFAGGDLSPEQKKIYTNFGAEDEDTADRKLTEIKDRIRSDWDPFCYDCRWDREKETEELRTLGDASQGRLVDFSVGGRPLREVILEEMKRLITREYPDCVPDDSADPFEEDASEQDMFVRTTVFDFVGREEELEKISRFVRDTGGTLVITAPEGTGKTALLCRAQQKLREEGHRVISRFAGASSRSMSELDLYLSIGQEAGLFQGTEEEKDSSLANRERFIRDEFLADLKKNGYDVLIVDGQYVFCSPPEGFTLIVTEEELKPDRYQDAERIMLPPLETRAEREQLIDQFLLHTLKKMDDEQKQQIVQAPGAGYPLYLRVLLNELKNFGSFADLQAKIMKFGDTPQSAFREMLAALETRFAEIPGFIPAAFGLLAVAPDGLSEQEMMTGLKELDAADPELLHRLRNLLRYIRPYLNRYGHRYAFRYGTLKDVAADLYTENTNRFRKALAVVYEENLRAAEPSPPDEWNDVHGDRELLLQLELAGEWDEILRILEDPDLFEKIYPTRYGCYFVHGWFYPVFEKKLGFSLDRGNSAEREIVFRLAALFQRRGFEQYSTIRDRYRYPYAEYCDELRIQEDSTAFIEFRNLFYLFIAYLDVSVRLMLSVCRFAAENESGRAEIKEACKAYRDRDRNNIFSFLQAMTIDGAEITGLSHQIEDLAGTPYDGYREILKYIESV